MKMSHMCFLITKLLIRSPHYSMHGLRTRHDHFKYILLRFVKLLKVIGNSIDFVLIKKFVLTSNV
jgi:hypothetical protein